MKKILIISCFLFLSILNAEESLNLDINSGLTERYVVGEKIRLRFDGVDHSSRLVIYGSFGKTIVRPEVENEILVFNIPQFILNKAGSLNWNLVNTTKPQTGLIEIASLENPRLIENYFGPRSIQAGEKDYSMLVSIPTDKYDNPLGDGVLVEISEYFHGDLQWDGVEVKNMFAWKNIYTRKKTGNIIIGNSCKSIRSKEMVSQIYPSVPTNFRLSMEREHSYADGNQVAKIKTSIIRDEFENIVSDGTSVEFLIKDPDGSTQKTYATTIDGVATAQLLHPEEAQKWNISANITGMAKSDEITISFQPVLEDFEVSSDWDKKKISVGPLTSFLGQFVPDGTQVVLKILDENNQLQNEFMMPSREGYATFQLGEDVDYPDSFTFKIETLGQTKILQ